MAAPRIDLDKSEFDLSTFSGRLRHFFNVTDPRTVLASKEELYAAKTLVEQYREGKEPAGTTEAELRRAKKLFDSAFHPQTGELNFILGRMSFQVPGNMFITGGMLTFYRTPVAVMFWQWLNQSFNAIVNYTNRNATEEVDSMELVKAYTAATASATGTALGFNFVVQKFPALASGLVGRLVPFTAVAAANCVNIPLMRQKEIQNGIQLMDASGKVLLGDDGTPLLSSKAAEKGIFSVVFSRVVMAVPGMVLPPLLMNHLEKKGTLKRFPRLALPLQTLVVGACLVGATPFGCAIFPQTSEMETKDLEPRLQEQLNKQNVDRVYFNKGL